MPQLRCVWLTLGAATALAIAGAAEIRIDVERVPNDDAEPGFVLSRVPGPRTGDAAERGQFHVVQGRCDANAGGLGCLNDGRLPAQEDQPRANVFFAAGGDGGWWLLDLGRVTDIARVGTYSWHPGWRAPQVYALYGSRSEPGGTNGLGSATRADLDAAGWQLLAAVDTRPTNQEPGGVHAVSVNSPAGTLGRFRQLLFVIQPTEKQDPFGHTFYSEIDVVESTGDTSKPVASASVPRVRRTLNLEGGYEVVLDLTEAPDLQEWSDNSLVPMIRTWYPKLAVALASDGFAAPAKVRIRFDGRMSGVADTVGARVRCGSRWFRDNLKGEAVGAVFHELVHVVQQYQDAPRREGSEPVPGWLVEGIADYQRWYVYEPESRGAAISAERAPRVRYDNSYRVTANFLDWVTRVHGPGIVAKLNAAAREGRYREVLWQELTGQPLKSLGEAWQAALAAR